MSLLAGRCPDCGTVIRADNPPELATRILQHRCSTDPWLPDDLWRRAQMSSVVYLPESPVERQLRLTRRALRWAMVGAVSATLGLTVLLGMRLLGL